MNLTSDLPRFMPMASCSMARALCYAALFGGAAGHSSLLVPPSRNAVDKALPPWRNGSFGPGAFGDDAWGCNCVNATTGGQVPLKPSARLSFCCTPLYV